VLLLLEARLPFLFALISSPCKSPLPDLRAVMVLNVFSPPMPTCRLAIPSSKDWIARSDFNSCDALVAQAGDKQTMARSTSLVDCGPPAQGELLLMLPVSP
jgi:hypothetical protein